MQKKGTTINGSQDSDREAAVLWRLREHPDSYRLYESLEEKWQKRFLDYCTGKKILPLTYDPFFKRIFNPDIHPGRLSRFLSSILGRKVKVIRILPGEEYLLDGGALLIMDILVELEDGTLVNCEIQKIPYLFPGERMSCYSSDLVLRQYSRVRGEKGKSFKYNDMKPVYTIVIYEKSVSAFHDHPNSYIHHGKTTFDTDLDLNLLQEYWLIALDVFRKIPYSKEKNERTAWLSFLATEDMEEAGKLAVEYPWLAEIYQEMEEYGHEPKEVLNMFSEALRILDRNTVQYMIEQQQEDIEQKLEQILQQQEIIYQKEKEINQQQNHISQQEDRITQQQNQLSQQEDRITQQQNHISQQEDQITQQQNQLSQQEDRITQQQNQLSQQKDRITQQQNQLSRQEDQINRQQAEIARLKKLLKES